MHVPYFDLKRQYSQLRHEVQARLDRVCESSEFILGSEVQAFEAEFATYCGVKHCVAVNSGTSALHLALIASDVKAGDEVITVANTFVATAEAIAYVGATPVFVDIDPLTGGMDPALIAPAITPKTKAIVPVHLYGHPVDMGAVLAIAGQRGIPVIEDACQAHGARWNGTRVGSFGIASAFSFYPGKNLGAYGDCGALVTNDDRTAEMARVLRDHGQSRRYHHDVLGYNYRMDGFQGAVLRLKLQQLDAWNVRRRAIADHYRQVLDGITQMPSLPATAESVYHLFVVWNQDRDATRARLAERGVNTAVHYPVPVHRQPPFARLQRNVNLPYTDTVAKGTISLPIFPEMTPEEVSYVASTCAEVMASTARQHP